MLQLSGISPAEGEKLVSPEAEIEFTVEDDGNGIDISTLIVEIDGVRAIDASEFQDGYDGGTSGIETSGDDYVVVIDPETDFEIGAVVSVQIQVQDLSGNYFNRSYSFKIVPAEPVLINADPEDGDTLTSPQQLLLEFEDTINGVDADSLTITINDLAFVTDGEINFEENSSLAKIEETDDGLAVRLDPIEALKNGSYTLDYQISDPDGNKLQGSLVFTVKLVELVLPKLFPQASFLGGSGLVRVSDLGVGTQLKLEWNKPLPRSYQNEVFVLLYQNKNRLDVFNDPVFLATSEIQSFILEGLKPSETLSYAARVLEFTLDTFDVSGMVEEGTNFYRLPAKTHLAVSMDTDDLNVQVDSVAGYPAAGYLQIGTELMKYTSLTASTNTFHLPNDGRGLLSSTPSVYLPGDEVKLFLACTDKNTVIIMGTPTYQDGYESGRELNYEGVVVSDFSDSDRMVFDGFDFCGYHQPLPWQVLNGKNDCGSYLGGEYNGFRGFNLYERMLDNEEVLLEQVGEPVVLLKRNWSGKVCSCMDPRRQSTKVKNCGTCFGSGFDPGFIQFFNPRRADTRIMVHFNESPEDLALEEEKHLHQEFEPNAWTLAIPSIRDRDLLIRFDFTDDIEFIYEVLNVSREKILFRKFGRQNLALKRLDKSDLKYTFKYIL